MTHFASTEVQEPFVHTAKGRHGPPPPLRCLDAKAFKIILLRHGYPKMDLIPSDFFVRTQNYWELSLSRYLDFHHCHLLHQAVREAPPQPQNSTNTKGLSTTLQTWVQLLQNSRGRCSIVKPKQGLPTKPTCLLHFQELFCNCWADFWGTTWTLWAPSLSVMLRQLQYSGKRENKSE